MCLYRYQAGIKKHEKDTYNLAYTLGQRMVSSL